MKHFSVGMLVAASVAFGAAEAPGFKVGYIDVNKAIATTEAGKSAKAQLEKEITQRRTAYEKQQTDLQAEAEAFEKKQAIMNESARTQKQQEIQKKAFELQKSGQEIQMNLAKRERELMQPLLDEVKVVAATIAKDKGYNLILEENGGAVIYAEPGHGLTDDLVSRFNAKNKGKKKS